jgi:predicted nucleotidyltransferase
MKIPAAKKKAVCQAITNIIASYLNLKEYKIFYFGSRVTEKGNERADIDIGIEGKTPIPLTILRKIKDEIVDLPFLYKIDLVDFKRVSSEFKQIALQTIEPIL